MADSIVVYLLHAQHNEQTTFTQEPHYVGSSTSQMFSRRLREHFGGYGAEPTRLLFEAGYRLALSRVWLSASRSLEYKIQRLQCPQRLCPLCNPEAHRLTVTEEGVLTTDPKSVLTFG